jgi:hypothetical protein
MPILLWARITRKLEKFEAVKHQSSCSEHKDLKRTPPKKHPQTEHVLLITALRLTSKNHANPAVGKNN